MRTWLLALAAAGCLAGESVIAVADRYLDVNGQAEVPAGLFGVHGVPLTPELVADWGIAANRIILHGPDGKPVRIGRHPQAPAGLAEVVECFWDRFQPAHTLTDPAGWRDRLRTLGTRYGEAARATGQRHVIEFWNEPYLNWSVKPGVNLDPWWYETADAVEGGPVRIKGSAEPVPHLRWQRRRWFEAVDRAHDRVPLYIGLGLIGSVWRGFEQAQLGEEFVLFGGRRRVRPVETLVPVDTSQRLPDGRQVWFSALANADHYARMYEVLAGAVKAADPQVRMLAGWGFNYFQDGWLGWELTHQPVLDRCHALVDGLHEHHYGIAPELVAASYETAAAITRLRYGRALPSWNTEAGANWDPQRPDQHLSEQERWIRAHVPAGQAAAFSAYAYLVGDILVQLATCPDKARGRAAHHSHETGGGDAAGFRQLKSLRGRLLAVDCGDPSLHAVAALDGTRLAVGVVNRSLADRPVRLRLAQPVADGRRLTLALDADAIGLMETQGVSGDDGVVLPPLQAVTWTFRLDGPPPRSVRRVRQHHVPAALRQLGDAPVELDPALPAAELRAATATRLTAILSGPPGAVGAIRIGGRELAIPADERVRRTPLAPGDLDGRLTIAAPGCRLWAASLDLIDELPVQ